MRIAPMTRRAFLSATGAATVSGATFSLQACSEDTAKGSLPLDLFLTVADDALVFFIPRSEMGQDLITSFALVIGEELETPPHQIRVEMAQAQGQISDRMTVGSSSIRNWWQTMRLVGAGTRDYLLALAAAESGLPAAELRLDRGEVLAANGTFRRHFTALLKSAGTIEWRVSGKPKSPDEYRWVGTHTPALFNREKVTGQFQFLHDIPEARAALKVAMVNFEKRDNNVELPDARMVARFQREYKLVATAVTQSPPALYIAHQKTWPLLRAKTAIEALTRSASTSAASATQTSAFDAHLIATQSANDTNVIERDRITLTFSTPAIAQSPLEPPAASLRVADGRCTVWAATQAPEAAREAVANTLELAPAQVVVHPVAMGGGFGRKRYTDYLTALAQAARALAGQGVQEPLTLIWTHEDELAQQRYRPASWQQLRWSSQQPNSIGWDLVEGYRGQHGPSWQAMPVTPPVELAMTPRKRALFHPHRYGIWRAVHHAYHAFALCSMVDEMCQQQQRDPIDYYLSHPPEQNMGARIKQVLKGRASPAERLRQVITSVRRDAHWQWPTRTKGMGFAAYTVFGSYIAVIAKVDVHEGRIRISDVWASVDCGRVIHRDKLIAQIEGGILYGLSACLLTDTPPLQQPARFDVLRMTHTPRIHVRVLNSEEAPTGAGELGVPPIAPAVTNALRTLTPLRCVTLPVTRDDKLNFATGVEVLSHAKA